MAKLNNLTFKLFLEILKEDASQDVQNLRGRIAQLNTTLEQRTSLLKKQKETLEKQLEQKLKQQEAEKRRHANTVPNTQVTPNISPSTGT